MKEWCYLVLMLVFFPAYGIEQRPEIKDSVLRVYMAYVLDRDIYSYCSYRFPELGLDDVYHNWNKWLAEEKQILSVNNYADYFVGDSLPHSIAIGQVPRETCEEKRRIWSDYGEVVYGVSFDEWNAILNSYYSNRENIKVEREKRAEREKQVASVAAAEMAGPEFKFLSDIIDNKVNKMHSSVIVTPVAIEASKKIDNFRVAHSDLLWVEVGEFQIGYMPEEDIEKIKSIGFANEKLILGIVNRDEGRSATGGKSFVAYDSSLDVLSHYMKRICEFNFEARIESSVKITAKSQMLDKVEMCRFFGWIFAVDGIRIVE